MYSKSLILKTTLWSGSLLLSTLQLPFSEGFSVDSPEELNNTAVVTSGELAVENSQSFTAADFVSPVEISRDSYAATSTEEVQAIQTARAEAEVALRRAEQEKAAEEARIAAIAQARSSAAASAPTNFASPPQGYSGENVLAYAEQFVGVVPYGTGNHPDDSFSCDGYVQYVFAGFGISLPRTANAQAALGTAIPQSEARVGDLLWWPDTHIAIYDGRGGMLDSPDWGKNVRHRADIWGNPVFIRLN